ncbi:GFA family protein [Lichenifustis flavocetrariae]|uniref:GFA family protein n=1 Tax=Lichenifustis flavocetrariae TaxID=2949735 RepID=A0AA42CJ62_9HYPH|nr:GFA family protein [Lichenifustis flavocetrariae]MCW6507666.1 GFA family protein [Lichenifustis flavocetrariae]
MNTLDHPRDGGCRCGHVRFRVSMLPLLTMACHCRGCQRMTASAFSLSVAIPSEGFAVTQGDTVLGGLQKELQHSFCPECKSWLFTRMPGMDGFVNVRSTLIDDLSWTTPFVETCTKDKLDWVTTPAVHRFEAFPAMDDWQSLTQAYQAYSLETPSFA